MKKQTLSLDQDPWVQLKKFTRARIALGRVGSSLPTKEILNFGLSHAMARDAVHLALDMDDLANKFSAIGLKTIQVQSHAHDRASYLLRPDFGRRLHTDSLSNLQSIQLTQPIDLLIVIGDGLSALAVERHSVPLVAELQKILPTEWRIGPIVLASQARVAIADEISEIVQAKMVAMIIGERPGLSSPDSLGIYLTYAPKLGCNDANRNCISNVRPEGLAYAAAAKKLMWLAREAMRLQCSGVALKDESDITEVDAVKQAYIESDGI